MAYKIVKDEWELTEEEKDKAAFMLQYCEEEARNFTKGVLPNRLITGSFDGFKQLFYEEVKRRLGIFSFSSGYGAFGISDDITKLVAYRVIRE